MRKFIFQKFASILGLFVMSAMMMRLSSSIQFNDTDQPIEGIVEESDFLNATEDSEFSLQNNGSSLSSAEDKNDRENWEKTIETTLRHLREGDERIILDDQYRDLILLAGNTGAGKTTLAKFISFLPANSDLEAYWAGDRFLIKDLEGKISVNSTLVSKSIFPELFIDQETNTAFYDLPGFSDTRHPSYEIANAFFMKKVADHAKRIKILFIVNYSSVRSGESRTAFKNLLDHATNFLKGRQTSKKFLDGNGLALIASKVESSQSQDRIVRGIASFLESVKTSLNTLVETEDEREHAKNILNAFLSKDNNNSTDLLQNGNGFNKIGIFRQPEDEGPLNQMTDMMNSTRPKLRRLIWSNLQFVQTTPSDFGISVSPSGKLLAKNLVEKVQTMLARDVANLAQNVAHNTKIKFTSVRDQVPIKIWLLHVLNSLQEWQRDFGLVKSHDELSKLLQTEELCASLKVNETEQEACQNFVSRVLSSSGILDFLEQILDHPLSSSSSNDRNSPLKSLEMASIFDSSLEYINTEIFLLDQKLDRQMLKGLFQLRNHLERNFSNTIGQDFENDDNKGSARELLEDLKNAHDIISNTTSRLLTIQKVDEFPPIILAMFESMKIEKPESLMTIFFKPFLNPENVTAFDWESVAASLKFLPFRIRHDWLKPLIDILKFLEQEMDQLNRFHGFKSITQNLNESMATLEKKIEDLSQNDDEYLTQAPGDHETRREMRKLRQEMGKEGLEYWKSRLLLRDLMSDQKVRQRDQRRENERKRREWEEQRREREEEQLNQMWRREREQRQRDWEREQRQIRDASQRAEADRWDWYKKAAAAGGIAFLALKVLPAALG